MEKIAAELKESNHEAFAKIYKEFWSKVYNFSRIYMISSDDAKEAVQTVFIQLWENRESIKEEQNIEGLIFIMTRNYIFNQSKKKLNEEAYKTYVLQAYNAEYMDGYCNIEEQMNVKQLAKHIDSLMQLLPERQQMAFALSRKKHLTYKEIALRMDISEKAVEKLMSKALKFLKENYTLFLLFLYS